MNMLLTKRAFYVFLLQLVTKRRLDDQYIDEDEILAKVKKDLSATQSKSVMLSSSAVCSQCSNPVFISERVHFFKKLYHRSCFKCYNCHKTLNPHTAEVSSDGLILCADNSCSTSVASSPHLSSIARKQMDHNNIINNSNKPSANPMDGISTSRRNQNNPSTSLTNGIPDLKKGNTDDSQVSSTPRALYPKGRVSAMAAHFDNAQGDSQSQGDIQIGSVDNEKRIANGTETDCNLKGTASHTSTKTITAEPSDTVVHGADKESELSLARKKWLFDSASKKPTTTTTTPKPEEDSQEKVNGLNADTEEQSDGSDKVDSIAVNHVTEPEDVNKETDEKLVSVKKTSEILNIRSQAVLNIADQIRKSVPPAHREALENKDTKTTAIKVDENNGNGSTSITVESNSKSTTEEGDIGSAAAENDKVVVLEAIGSKEAEEMEKRDGLGPEIIVSTPNSTKSSPRPSPLPRKKSPAPPTPTPRKRESTDCNQEMPKPSPRVRSRKTKSSDLSRSGSSTSAKEIWRNTDYYPAELNPFESEEHIGDSTTQAERTHHVPKNPFEDEDDEDFGSCNKNESAALPRQDNNGKGASADPRAEINNNNNNSLRETSESPNCRFLSHGEGGRRRAELAPSPPKGSPGKNHKDGDDTTSGGKLYPHVDEKKSPKIQKEYNPFEDDEDEDCEDILSTEGTKGNDNNNGNSPFARGRENTGSTTSSRVSNYGGSLSGTPLQNRSYNSSDVDSLGGGSVSSAPSKKKRRAPLPPNMMGTGPEKQEPSKVVMLNGVELAPASPKSILKKRSSIPSPVEEKTKEPQGENNSASVTALVETPKTGRKLIPASPDLLKGLKINSAGSVSSSFGRSKKRRAPPPKRKVDPLPLDDIKIEYSDLEVQQKELERQGIALEAEIRRLESEVRFCSHIMIVVVIFMFFFCMAFTSWGFFV